MLQLVLPWFLAAAPSLPKPTQPVAPELDAPTATERLESIAPDPDGRGGTVVARSIVLDGGRSTLVYGGKHCPRLDATVVGQLFEALRNGQGVAITARSGRAGVQCLERVTFYAPDA